MPNQPYQPLINALLKQQQAEPALPPVASWNPPFSGDIDIRIASNGSWYHQGKIIERQSLVKLFSGVLKREGDDYFLVTPVEKWRIQVDTKPFIIALLDIVDKGTPQQTLMFTCNTGDYVVASSSHPIKVDVDPQSGEPSPHILVRDNLQATISRAVFYQLADIAQEFEGADDVCYGVLSRGQFFPLE